MLPFHGLKPSNAIRSFPLIFGQYAWFFFSLFFSSPRNIFATRGLSKYEENRRMDGVHSSLKQDGYSMLIVPRLYMHSFTCSCAPSIFDWAVGIPYGA